MPNEDQIAEWNGASGARWVANQERLDQMLAPFGAAALAAAKAQPGEAVIDVGCGAGQSSLELADAVAPDGSVLAVDVSEPLVQRARQRAQGRNGATFVLADASAYAFAPHSADFIFSRFGVMFFDDPVAAFANLRRALREGGRLAFVCWRTATENDWVSVPTLALGQILPHVRLPDPDAPGPFAFGDAAKIERILLGAGFKNLRLKPFDADLRFGVGENRETALDDAVEQAFQVGPLRRLLADATDDTRAAAAEAVRAAFAQRLTDDGVQAAGAAWIVTASP